MSQSLQKPQIPKPKLQGNPNHQTQTTQMQQEFLVIGDWRFFGTWSLGFGALFHRAGGI
jgi:hypothetical protein